MGKMIFTVDDKKVTEVMEALASVKADVAIKFFEKEVNLSGLIDTSEDICVSRWSKEDVENDINDFYKSLGEESRNNVCETAIDRLTNRDKKFCTLEERLSVIGNEFIADTIDTVVKDYVKEELASNSDMIAERVLADRRDTELENYRNPQIRSYQWETNSCEVIFYYDIYESGEPSKTETIKIDVSFGEILR